MTFSSRDKTAPNPRFDAIRRRDLKIARDVLNGMSLRTVAAEVGVTAARVRSIVHDVGRISSKLPLSKVKRKRSSANSKANQHQLVEKEGAARARGRAPPEMPDHDRLDLEELRKHKEWWFPRFDALEDSWGLIANAGSELLASAISAPAPESVARRLQLICNAFESVGGVAAIAELVDRSVSLVKRWIKGESEPNVADLRALCEASGASVEWIVFGTGAPIACSALIEYTAMEYHYREFDQLGNPRTAWRHCSEERRIQMRNAAHSSFLAWTRSERDLGLHPTLLSSGNVSNDRGRNNGIRV